MENRRSFLKKGALAAAAAPLLATACKSEPQGDKYGIDTVIDIRCGYDKAITFEFSHFMSPQSAYLQAGHLYDRYKEYFNL